MHLGSAGLLWAINGGKLVELHRDWAVIELPVNRSRASFPVGTLPRGKSPCHGIEHNDGLRPPLGILGERPVVGRRQRCPT
jgi:hypothetical protein